MKYFAVVLAAVGLASAQSLSEIPACAQSCIQSAVKNATTCSTTDYTCICNNENTLVGAATSCVITACGTDVATESVLPATEQFCSQVLAGGSVSSSATSTGASSSSTSGSASTTTGASSSTTGSSSVSSTMSSASTTTSSKSNMTTSASSTPSPVSTNAAAVLGGVGSLAMLAVGALAVL